MSTVCPACPQTQASWPASQVLWFSNEGMKKYEAAPQAPFSVSGVFLPDAEASMVPGAPSGLSTVGQTRIVAGQATSGATVWPEAGRQSAQMEMPGHKDNAQHNGHLKIQKPRKRLILLKKKKKSQPRAQERGARGDGSARGQERAGTAKSGDRRQRCCGLGRDGRCRRFVRGRIGQRGRTQSRSSGRPPANLSGKEG